MKIQPPLFLAAWCVVAIGITTSPRVDAIESPTLPNGMHSLSLTSSTSRSGVLVARDPQAVINIRLSPSTQSNVAAVAYPNQTVAILAENQSPDGFRWYQVRLNTNSREGWVRGDLVRVQSAGAASGFPSVATNPALEPEAPAPPQFPEAIDNPGNPYGFPDYSSPQRPVTPSPQPGAIATAPRTSPRRELVFGATQPNSTTATPQPAIATPGVGGAAPAPEGGGGALQRVGTTAVGAVNAVTDRVNTLLNPRRSQPNRFTQAQVDYFMEIALGTEWGTSNQLIRKWTQNVRIKVSGTRTSEDNATINRVIGELNELISGSGVQLTLDNNNPNVEIIYAPETDFSRLEPNYVPGNLGFFRTSWNAGVLNHAKILITSTNRVTQRERSHLLREELTQVMGLVRDSWRDQNSIFYQGWTDVNQYTDDDRAVIQILYLSNIRPGMSRSQVVSTLQAVSAQRQASSN